MAGAAVSRGLDTEEVDPARADGLSAMTKSAGLGGCPHTYEREAGEVGTKGKAST
jgi:hypothetical protein